jgi:disulfide bond formation protein DsbB
MTHDVIVVLAVLGIAGQVLVAAGTTVAVLALAGVRGPLGRLRRLVWGYELWAVALVAAISTGGSLFFSEVAHFPPCELCWYERICTYPVTAVALLAALASDFRVARYLLVLPFAGTCISVYHLLIENGVIGQSASCLVSAPGGCATRYISEFGFVTIPTLALTSSLLLLGLLGLASLNEKEAHHV